ncbi:hypothetical protein BS78_09G005100 [Paspalum vaginatum]|nr:hypothetical protein BS78_09G005100 [Paspalum vaginatum]
MRPPPPPSPARAPAAMGAPTVQAPSMHLSQVRAPPPPSMAGSGVGDSSRSATSNVADTPGSSSGPRKRGIKRRRDSGVGPDSRPYVEGRVSPLEESLRRYGDRGAGPIFVPRVGMEFDSCEEAFDFFNLYSWEMGFGIRYSSNQSYSKHGQTYRNMVMLVCVCAGSPPAGAKRSIMQGCPVLFKLLRTDDDGWYLKEFCGTHNHPLSESRGEKQCWKSHRQIDPHTKELIKNLKANNVDMPKVDSIVAIIFGRNTVTAGTKRALHSLSVQINREKSAQIDGERSVQINVEKSVHVNGEEAVQINREESVQIIRDKSEDVKSTIEVLNKLHEEDEGFANVVDLDCYGKIKTMMWTNGKSRNDYRCFGDAVTFDTTYKTDMYNMPFGLFIGTNNHFQSVVFAGVIMRDETVESFKWVFTQFVSLMGGETPQTILTDQCRAMEVALANKLPQVTHRWCKWHVFRTIKVELGLKYTKEFKEGLNKVCNHTLSPQEFEARWADLMKKHGLEADVYMSNIYENRKMWANAYFMGRFCGKQASTERSESAKHVLKGYVPLGAPMHVFVEQYHTLLRDWNEKEDAKIYEDRMAPKESSTGWPIESHAAAFYTRTMLQRIVGHIKLGASYDVIEIIPRKKYRLDRVDDLPHDKWSRISYEVDVHEDGELYHCECGLWEHMGMLCCHIIRVMMQLMVRKIPEKHLMVRWSRDARKVQPSRTTAQGGGSLHSSRSFRNASLSSKARELVDLGDLNMECYDYCYQSLCAAIDELKSRRVSLGDVAQLE